MTAEDHAKARTNAGWRSGNVWAQTDSFEGNIVKQLAIPAGAFESVSGDPGALVISNNYGTWPAAPVDQPIDGDGIWARLPVGSKAGDKVTGASWNTPKVRSRDSPEEVLTSYKNVITFNEATEGDPGLRPPQLGALHAVLGYWTTRRMDPSTVVMPTGTGKTETMLALLLAARPERLLVLVPSDSLREQVATKFESLGVLQELGIANSSALRPVVGRLEHGFTSEEAATNFACASNVLVATPQALAACTTSARTAMFRAVSHLFVDEAHHVPAQTWSSIRQEFSGKHVVQFTATPFREDGKHLQGRIIYSYPLREAQANQYFSRIEYTAVIDLDDIDQAVAKQSIAKLQSDLASGFDHILMARVAGISRAKEIKPYYDRLAPELEPVIINSRLSAKDQRRALDAVRSRRSRIILCVNMLGEGFDLPALKVAALHDPQKSLGITLQFIGRFARASPGSRYGDASIFVARTGMESDTSLRQLYSEDSDWNLILRDLTEAAVRDQQDISDFEEGFTSLPAEVALRSLLPKMSAVVYRTPTMNWEPQHLVDFFGEENLLTMPIGLNAEAGVAWCVVKHRQMVRWGDLRTIEEVNYELYVLYFDSAKRMLCINNSANDGVFEDLAGLVAGTGCQRFTGSTVYRVMADIDRLRPTNVGVLDAHDQFRRFSMHVGSDVTASFSQAEAGTKSQTNISGAGYRKGEYVNISASLKGRIWSHSTATSLKHWRDWCDSIGAKLLDATISIDRVIGQFILPLNLEELPDGVLLSVEWPWSVHTKMTENTRVSFNGNVHPLPYTDLIPHTYSRTGTLAFDVKTPAWSVTYEARVEKGRLRYSCQSDEELLILHGRSEQPLSDWFNTNGLLFILDDDRVIEGNLLIRPTWDKPPFDQSRLKAFDWTGTNIRIESQTKDRLINSIQYRAIAELKRHSWDIILDDDGSGEIADIVAIRLEDESLFVKLLHCKFSHGEVAGSRVADLYEVCGQAQKSVMWRRNDLQHFFRTLEDRARRKQAREGISPFEVGDVNALYKLQERAKILPRRMEIVVVQPGLSASHATTQQLDLLASTQAYLRTTINAPLMVWCSR